LENVITSGQVNSRNRVGLLGDVDDRYGALDPSLLVALASSHETQSKEIAILGNPVKRNS